MSERRVAPLIGSGSVSKNRWRALAGGFILPLSLASVAQAAEPRAAGGEPATPIEEFIVTAERLGRTLMDTSTSVIVLDAEALAQRAADAGVSDIVASMPNVSATGRSSFAPTVRGVDGTGPSTGADAFFAGTRPRLGVQVDGRPASYNEIVFGDFGVWDVQQVEILRGSQSTLQGRNSLAGTVAVKTADPTYQFESKLRAMVGNQDTRQYSAAVSGPIVDDQVAFRIAADRRTSESFVGFAPFPGVKNPGEFEANTYRAKLLIEPRALDDFSALITVNHSDFTGPQTEAVAEPYDSHTSRFENNSSVFEPSATSGIVDLRWDVSDTLGMQALMSYSDLGIVRRAPPGAGNATIDGHEFVAEPSVRFGSGSSRLKGLAGAYFFDASQKEYIDLFGGGTFDDSTRTAALFGEATYAFSDTFDVTLGARYEEERRERNGSIFVFSIDLEETYKNFLPKLVLTWHPSDTVTAGVLASRGYNGGSAGFTFRPPYLAYTFDPEYVWNYEFFTRASLADGRLMLAANVFYSDYEDMQLPYYLSSVSIVVRNAEKVTTYGAELTATWAPLAELRIVAGLGTTSSDIKKFPDSGVEGNELPRAADLSASFGVHYAHPSGVELSLDGRYSGAYYSTIVNNPVEEVDTYTTVNARVAYTLGSARIYAFARNLFDAGDPLIITQADAFGAGYAQIIAPRTYGVGVQLDF